MAAAHLPPHNVFTVISVCGKIIENGETDMDPHIEKLREKYIQNPPEGLTAADIRSMSENDLLDMDYHLHEDDDFDDDDDDDLMEEGFYIF
jgi:hypothetical protein